MIELNKEDLTQIASNRFYRVYWRRIVVFAAILVAGVVALAFLVPDSAPNWNKAIGISGVVIVYMAGVVWLVRAIERYTKDFIAQCEADPELWYKGDQ